MAQTYIPFGSPQAKKIWGTMLYLQMNQQGYFSRRFIGDDSAPVQRITDLQSSKGDTVKFDLVMQFFEPPVKGDRIVEGTAENLRFYQDEVRIDQLRHQASAGGSMTQQRTVHNLRLITRQQHSIYWANYNDQLLFIYASGSRGMNQDYIEPLDFIGHARNPIQEPDSEHILYPEGVTGKANMTADSIMTRDLIEQAKTKADMMQAENRESTGLRPILIEGEEHYVAVMSPYQSYSLRTSDVAGWLDIQKAAAAAEGRNNPIFKGSLGMINGVVLHEHKNVIRFSDYGANGKIPAARALFMGAQAMTLAYGGTPDATGMSRINWVEETKDAGNLNVITTGCIQGVKKTRFNDRDFGIVALDTYAKNPTDRSAS